MWLPFPEIIVVVHEIAKRRLEQADTFLERTKAIEAAMDLGMPLHEIEEYLDWLDMLRSRREGESED